MAWITLVRPGSGAAVGVTDRDRRSLNEAAGRGSLLALGAVAVAYLIAQFVVHTPRMFLGADESLYYSQFARDVPAGYMGAPRAWGVPLLAAPVNALTGSIVVLRLYLAVLSAGGLFLAFWPWQRLRRGPVVPVAALLFAGLWVTLFYGPELMPNLPGALCGVAAVGLFAHTTGWGDRPDLPVPFCRAWIVVALGLMSLLRPTESLPLVVPLLAAGALLPGEHRIRTLVAIAAGFGIGWTAWSIEASIRFGGLAARLARNDFLNDVGWHFSVLRHLEAFGSATELCNGTMPACGSITLPAVLIWVGIPLFVALGLWTARGASHAPALWLAAVVGVATALPYLFYTSLANPRFLLTTYALLALPAAEGVTWLAARGRAARGAVAAALAVTVVHQGALAFREGVRAERTRSGYQVTAERLMAAGLRRPCLVYGPASWQLAAATGCHSLGDRLLHKINPGPARVRRVLDKAVSRGTMVAIVVPSATPASSAPASSSGAGVLTAGLTARALGPDTLGTAYLIPPVARSAG